MKLARWLAPRRPQADAAGETERVQVSLAGLLRLAPAAATLARQRSPKCATQAGNYLSRIKGRGMEFDEVRAYVPGDDVRSLDWRVTARTGKPHTKLFHEERERPVFIGVDYSRSMFFATRGRFKSVMAAQLAALAAWRAFHHGDRVGGQIFSEAGQTEIKPKNGKPALLHWLQRLAEHSAIPDTVAEAPLGSPIDQALARLCRHARPGSLILLLSDFRQLGDEGRASLMRLSRHCEIMLFFIFDPLEQNLPAAGLYPLSDGHRELRVDTAGNRQRAAYRERFQQRRAELERFAKIHGIGVMGCSTGDDPVTLLRRGGRHG